MDTATTITIRRVEDATELYRHYDGEHEPQPCYIYLDLEDGELRCDYSPSIGTAVTDSEFHRRTLTLSIPCLTADAANELLDEVAPIAQRVLDGASIEWDGNNHVGELTDEASAAYDELAAVVQQWVDDPHTPTVNTLHADDWYIESDPADELGLTADTTDAELDAMEETAEAAIKRDAEGVVVVLGLYGYLTELRDAKREQAREELETVAEQLDTLIERRNTLTRRVKRFGDSDRSIGELAGLSHTQVQNIVKAGPSA